MFLASACTCAVYEKRRLLQSAHVQALAKNMAAKKNTLRFCSRSYVSVCTLWRGLLIPLGYLHPGKCEHSEVQSHRSCHGRFLSLCACASHHRFQKYGGQHEERTLAEGFRKGENEDKNDCHKTTKDT